MWQAPCFGCQGVGVGVSSGVGNTGLLNWSYGLLGILEVLIQLVDVYNWILGILVSILTISIVDTLLDLRSKDAGKLGHKVSSIAPHDRAEDRDQYKETGQNQSNAS